MERRPRSTRVRPARFGSGLDATPLPPSPSGRPINSTPLGSGSPDIHAPGRCSSHDGGQSRATRTARVRCRHYFWSAVTGRAIRTQFTRLLRAEYFLLRQLSGNWLRLAVKQWPGIGVTMECARDAPLPRPSTVMPCAYDFTRSCFLGSFALLTSPQPLCQCDAGRTLVLRPGLGVTMELETLLFGGLRGFAVRMCYKVLRPSELFCSHLATTLRQCNAVRTLRTLVLTMVKQQLFLFICLCAYSNMIVFGF